MRERRFDLILANSLSLLQPSPASDPNRPSCGVGCNNATLLYLILTHISCDCVVVVQVSCICKNQISIVCIKIWETWHKQPLSYWCQSPYLLTLKQKGVLCYFQLNISFFFFLHIITLILVSFHILHGMPTFFGNIVCTYIVCFAAYNLFKFCSLNRILLTYTVS